jgi:hypothetical protein
MNLLRSSPKSAGDYRFVWAFSIVVAVISAPFVVLFKESIPWLIAVPLCGGVLVILIYEYRAIFEISAEHDVMITLSEEFKGLFSYDRLIALEVKETKTVPKGQLALFPAFQEPTPRNALRRVMDESGQNITIVSADRFSALLVTYLIENMDKATEKSLRAGLARFGQMGKHQSDLQAFVHDKVIREIIKSDFRGNLATLVSKGGEKIIKDLLKAESARREEEQKKAIEAERQALHARAS